MFSLDTIIAMNRKAARKARRSVETETSRHCSFSGNYETGLVLHSAKLRNTVWLSPEQSQCFAKAFARLDIRAERDAFIEAYFA